MIEFTEITDFNAPELDVYARLTEAQLLNRFEPKKGMFIAESPKVICRALDAGCRPVSLLVERSHCNEEAQAAIARCGDVPVYTAEMPILTQLTGFQLTRGMLCAMLRPRQPEPKEILAACRRVAVLENVMNPTNVGAIFRSAAALGMDRPTLSPQRPGEYGHGFSGALGLCAGELAGNSERGGLCHRRHGADGRQRVH